MTRVKTYSAFVTPYLILTLFVAVLYLFPAYAQDLKPILITELDKPIVRREIHIPRVGDYVVLKCDFHMHTVFSDGGVWPDFRVVEAWVTGLDAVAITDHVEGPIDRPFLTGDDNSSYELAKNAGERYNILIIRGCEITRKHPYGHYNALFLEDANLVDHEDPFTAIENAVKQGAFIQWNHPEWNPTMNSKNDFRNKLLEKGYLHGVEVVNGAEWYPHMIDWAKERNLTLLGNSDLHGVITGEFNLDRFQRPMTLVLAKERSIPAIREALDNHRTVVWIADRVIGREEWLTQLFHSCIQFEDLKILNPDNKEGKMTVRNISDIPWYIQFTGPLAFGEYRLEPRSSAIVRTRSDNNTLNIKVTNAWVGKDENLKIQTQVPFQN